MDEFLSVFNQHVNNAGKKAEQDVIIKFGKGRYKIEFLPFKRKGIMSIFQVPPTELTKFYAKQVKKYVKELSKQGAK